MHLFHFIFLLAFHILQFCSANVHIACRNFVLFCQRTFPVEIFKWGNLSPLLPKLLSAHIFVSFAVSVASSSGNL